MRAIVERKIAPFSIKHGSRFHFWTVFQREAPFEPLVGFIDLVLEVKLSENVVFQKSICLPLSGFSWLEVFVQRTRKLMGMTLSAIGKRHQA